VTFKRGDFVVSTRMLYYLTIYSINQDDSISSSKDNDRERRLRSRREVLLVFGVGVHRRRRADYDSSQSKTYLSPGFKKCSRRENPRFSKPKLAAIE
jgi:hypothetical protein